MPARLARLEGGTTINLENAFAMTIADDVPNMTKADFILTCSDGTDTWTSRFAIRLYAPDFAIVGTVIEDSDNNGHIDPGETVTAHITVMNTGMSAAPNAQLNILCDIPEITFNQNEFSLGTIEPNDELSVDFVFTLSEEVPLGMAYEIGFVASSGPYSAEGSFGFAVGNVVENWETGDFSKFEWENDYSIPWTVVTESPYGGNYCVKSGNIGDNTTTSLTITIDALSEGEISFYKKVSSEAYFDQLQFYIDANLQDEWSGEVEWEEAHYPLTPGQHELKWTYFKDMYVSDGSDCAWLDNIVFPPAEILMVTQEIASDGISLYPNPNQGQFSIKLPEEDCEIIVFNSVGQQVYRQNNAKGMTSLNLEGLNNGMYFITVKSVSAVRTMKFVKE